MTVKTRTWLCLVALGMLGMCMCLGGCTCSEDADTTAEEFTGERKLKQFDQMKKDIKKLDQRRQEERDKLKGE